MPAPESESKGETLESTKERTEQHPFVKLLGNRTRAMIFVTLHDAPSPMNPNDIVDSAGFSRNAWYDNYEILEEYGVIDEVGQHGNSPLYALTDDDELVDALRKVADLAGARNRSETDPDTETDE